jgi:hypothetical protein
MSECGRVRHEGSPTGRNGDRPSRWFLPGAAVYQDGRSLLLPGFPASTRTAVFQPDPLAARMNHGGISCELHQDPPQRRRETEGVWTGGRNDHGCRQGADRMRTAGLWLSEELSHPRGRASLVRAGCASPPDLAVAAAAGAVQGGDSTFSHGDIVCVCGGRGGNVTTPG